MGDSLGPFLYRRLARFVWCELKLPSLGANRGRVRLKSKWDVASFQDVFCHPYYWQALANLPGPPELVVDAGAHCGHFSVLANICIQTQFPAAEPKFVLIEPNPGLQSILTRTLADAGLGNRATVHQGLLGGRTGQGTLWVDKSNYLASGRDAAPGRERVDLTFVDLAKVLPPGPIDVMKLDIEGSEFDFAEHNPDILERVNVLVAEVHCDRAKHDAVFLPALARAGLRLWGEPSIGHAGCQLAAYRRG